MRLRVIALSVACSLLVGACSALDVRTGTTTTHPTDASDAPASNTAEPPTTAPTTTRVTTTSTSEAPAAAPGWSFDRTAVFGPGPTEWDSNFLIPGAIVPADDVLHIFYVGFDVQGNSIARGGVGYAISADGRDWVRVVEDPLGLVLAAGVFGHERVERGLGVEHHRPQLARPVPLDLRRRVRHTRRRAPKRRRGTRC